MRRDPRAIATPSSRGPRDAAAPGTSTSTVPGQRPGTGGDAVLVPVASNLPERASEDQRTTSTSTSTSTRTVPGQGPGTGSDAVLVPVASNLPERASEDQRTTNTSTRKVAGQGPGTGGDAVLVPVASNLPERADKDQRTGRVDSSASVFEPAPRANQAATVNPRNPQGGPAAGVDSPAMTAARVAPPALANAAALTPSPGAAASSTDAMASARGTLAPLQPNPAELGPARVAVQPQGNAASANGMLPAATTDASSLGSKAIDAPPVAATSPRGPNDAPAPSSAISSAISSAGSSASSSAGSSASSSAGAVAVPLAIPLAIPLAGTDTPPEHANPGHRNGRLDNPAFAAEAAPGSASAAADGPRGTQGGNGGNSTAVPASVAVPTALPTGAVMTTSPAAAPVASEAATAGALATATLSTALHSPAFAPALGQLLTLWARDGVSQARIHLNPAELGPVRVEIQLNGNAAQLLLTAQNPETRQALEQAMPVLASSLRESGLVLSGGGVFEQSQQPPQQQREAAGDGSGSRGGGNAGAEARHDDRSRNPGSADNRSADWRAAPAQRQRGMVDLVA